MKKLLIVASGLLFLFIACSSTHAQNKDEATITTHALIKDLEEYRDGINKFHIDPYNTISKKQFYHKIEELKQSANEYNFDELFIKLLIINALIQDGHTNIQFKTRYMYPFIFQKYEEGFYIIATNDENRKYYHARILAINDNPIDTIVNRIATIVPEQNRGYINLEAQYYLINPTVLHGLQIITDKMKAVYTVQTPDGKIEKIAPAVIEVKDRNQLTGLKPDKFLRTSLGGKYWFKYFDSNKTVYFNYRSCTDDGTFKTMMDALMDTIVKMQPKKIVIDMRYNSGGNSSLLMPFVNYLSKSNLNKNGGIYVLTGSKTFSSAVLNVLALKQQTRAILVGEPTGENAEHFGEVKFFILPSTQLKVSYSTKYFKNQEHIKGSIKPDVLIFEKFSEYDNNIDSVVDYALAQ